MTSGWTDRQCAGRARLLVIALLLNAIAMPAFAHEIRPAVVDILVQTDGRLQIEIRLNLEALLAGIGAAHSDTDDAPNAAHYRRLRNMPPDALRTAFGRSLDRFVTALDLRIDQRRLALSVSGVDIPEVGDTVLARESRVRLAARLPGDAKSLNWQWDEAFGAVVLRVDAEALGELHSAYLQPGEGSGTIDLGALRPRSASATFVDYLGVGFEHIVPKGMDHILFVVGLFLLSPRWGALLWQVSAFTLAHTITLALSMLGWVQLPSAIVEPLIAASIVYVCVENLFHDRLTRWRPLVVFGFGLLHGLGFASVLTDIGLSPGHFVAGLVGFNIGVEVGQLAVLAACFVLVGLWFRHRDWYRKVIAIPGSLLIALVGSFWFLERVSLF